LLFENWEIG